MQRRRTTPLKGESGRVKNRESVKAAKSPPRTPRTRETQQLEKRLKADIKRRTGTCTLHSNKYKQQYSDAQYEDTGDKCTSAFFSSVYKPVRAILFCLYSHCRRDRHPGESLDFYKALPVVVKILFFAEISVSNIALVRRAGIAKVPACLQWPRRALHESPYAEKLKCFMSRDARPSPEGRANFLKELGAAVLHSEIKVASKTAPENFT
uniref:Uncharacterized protein n=1 Tax=Toxoplasma gondii COUG TaxID=1074873 RepID=A0A2G8Y1X4_TOXGO|nr:hypothetical protein TGCOUG_268835 [Toxoplasma gondii COUG]